MDWWKVRLNSCIDLTGWKSILNSAMPRKDTCFLLALKSAHAVLAGESTLVGEHQKALWPVPKQEHNHQPNSSMYLPINLSYLQSHADP